MQINLDQRQSRGIYLQTRPSKSFSSSTFRGKRSIEIDRLIELWMISTVESQKDYHARRKHHHYPRTTTTTVLSTTKSPVSTTTVTAVVEQVEDNQIPEVTRWTTTEPTETWEITTTSSTTISTTPTTTTTTTTPPRKYTHAFPTRTHISPLSISSQRLLSSNLEFTWIRIIINWQNLGGYVEIWGTMRGQHALFRTWKM